MTTMPSEPIEAVQEWDGLCRWGIRAAWHLSLVWGGLVSLLSWTGGAAAATAVIRGLVTFVTFGLVGWGLNAVMAQAGNRRDDAGSDGMEAGKGPGKGEPEGAPEESAAPESIAGAAPDLRVAETSGQRMQADGDAGDGWGEPDYLSEAAS